jgi:hypothetical protein
VRIAGGVNARKCEPSDDVTAYVQQQDSASTERAVHAHARPRVGACHSGARCVGSVKCTRGGIDSVLCLERTCSVLQRWCEFVYQGNGSSERDFYSGIVCVMSTAGACYGVIIACVCGGLVQGEIRGVSRENDRRKIMADARWH